MATVTSAYDLIAPALMGLVAHGGNDRLIDAQLWRDFVTDEIRLRADYRLFQGWELADGSYKMNFRGRVEQLLGLKLPMDGVRVRVERRAFLARAARVRKAKPRPRV